MMKLFGLSRATLAVGAVTLALALAALAPGGFGTALAQTAGGGDESSSSSPPPGTTTTSTDPTTGTTTTTTTSTDGTKTTETTKTDGTKSTETAKPNGETTTVVTIPNQGTVTVVQAPGQPAQVTVAPANPNTDTTMQVDVLGAQLSVPGGTLSADETISIVEQSFNLAIVLGVTRVESGAPQGLQNFANEPGSIRPVRVFEMTVKKASGATGQIAKPIRMTWDFKPEDLAAAGGDFANLLMIGQNAATGKWSPVPQVAKTATSVTFEVPHFSLWAFAVRTPGVTPPPPPAGSVGTPAATAGTGAAPAAGTGLVPRPANTGTGIPAEQSSSMLLPMLAAAALGLGLAGGVALRTVRRRA